MSEQGWPRPEYQICIDECADGTWQASIYCGSNIVLLPDGSCYVNGATFREAAEKVAELVESGIRA